MSQHLSSEEISLRAAGEYSPAIDQHLNDCDICRSELALFLKSLELFRQSVHTWADRQRVSEEATVRRIRQAPYRSMRNAICVAALVLFACCAAWRMRPHPAAPVQSNIQSAESDTALLERVNAEISQTVPASLTPVSNLVAWERR
jgi:predicted anti-sigma-YlaC factor YlaD